MENKRQDRLQGDELGGYCHIPGKEYFHIREVGKITKPLKQKNKDNQARKETCFPLLLD